MVSSESQCKNTALYCIVRYFTFPEFQLQFSSSQQRYLDGGASEQEAKHAQTDRLDNELSTIFSSQFCQALTPLCLAAVDSGWGWWLGGLIHPHDITPHPCPPVTSSGS